MSPQAYSLMDEVARLVLASLNRSCHVRLRSDLWLPLLDDMPLTRVSLASCVHVGQAAPVVQPVAGPFGRCATATVSLASAGCSGWRPACPERLLGSSSCQGRACGLTCDRPRRARSDGVMQYASARWPGLHPAWRTDQLAPAAGTWPQANSSWQKGA